MQAVHETLSGIETVKMLGWERFLSARMRRFRDQEISYLSRLAKLMSLSDCSFSCSPVFVALMVFGLYVWIDPVENVLTPEKVFVCISLFSLMRLPLEIFPKVLFDLIR